MRRCSWDQVGALTAINYNSLCNKLLYDPQRIPVRVPDHFQLTTLVLLLPLQLTHQTLGLSSKSGKGSLWCVPDPPLTECGCCNSEQCANPSTCETYAQTF